MNATVSFLSPQKLAATRTAAASAQPPPAPCHPHPDQRHPRRRRLRRGKRRRRPPRRHPGQTSANGEMEILKGLSGGEDLILTLPPASRTALRCPSNKLRNRVVVCASSGATSCAGWTYR